MINLKNLLVELEFKTPEEFKKYKAKHKMRPGTVVKVAGKDKVVDDKPEVGTKVKDGKLKSSGPQQFADDVKNMKGEFDLDGGMKIKDGKMFDDNGNQMDTDDIEDFYYQDAFDEKGINVGIDVKEKPKSDEPKGKKAKVDSVEFSSFGEKDIKRFADRYGVKVKNIRSGQQGNLADFEGDPEKIKKMLTSDDYGMEPEDANDLLGIKDEPKVDKKTDKDMASAANKANMKMDRDEIMGLLNAKNEPFAEEVYDILDDNFDKMGSLGKELKQKVDTLAAYEMGIYDMSEKEYEQGREELKKKLDDYYKEQGLDEGIKELSKISTRYTNRINEAVDEGDFITVMQEIRAGIDEAEYGITRLGALGFKGKDKSTAKKIENEFKKFYKLVDKFEREAEVDKF
jgi:hypothetical protein